MTNRLGSHWRWRVAMVLIAISLIGYGWWQAGRWEARILVNYVGAPAVYRVVHRDRSQSIEVFDWKTGRQWTVAEIGQDYRPGEIEESVRISREGKTVAWRYGSEVRAVDIQSPNRRQTCKLPFLSSEHKLIGLSRDARFGVFQAVGVRRRLPNGRASVTLLDGYTGIQPAVFILSVVDLRSGEVVSSREWESHLRKADLEGLDEYRSYLQVTPPTDPTEPVHARWKLTDEGEWELLERVKQFNAQSVQMVREPPGEWLLVGDVSSLPADAVLAQAWVAKTFDSGKRFVTHPGVKKGVFSGSFETKRVYEIGQGDDITELFVTDDGATMVISNRRDDIVVFDLHTGKVIARDAAGSSRRNHLLGIGIGLLVLAAAWARTAISESKLSWGMLDALAATVLVQAAVFPIYSSFHVDHWNPLPVDLFRVIPTGVLHGAFVGSAIATGWYWAHGRAWFQMRWLFGTLWLIVVAVPLVAYNHNMTVYYGDAMVLRAWVIAGLVISGLTAALAVLFRPLGWSIRASAESQNRWRFGLMQLFSLTASVGIGLVLIQSLLTLPGILALLDISRLPSGSFFVGVPLAGMLFLQSRWAIALGTIVLVLAAVAGTYEYVEMFGASLSFRKPDRYIGEAVALMSTTLAMVLPCSVLRRHGWHWKRLTPVENFAEATA